MLHRSTKFVHAAVLAFSAVLSFLFLRDLDERWVMGHTAVVWVTDSTGATSGAQVTHLLAEFATTHKATVARETPDLKEPYSRRHLYLARGGPHSDWLHDGYPAFDRDYRTDVHPVADLGNRDPRGYYYVFGPERAVDELVGTFTGLGFEATAYHPYSLEQLTPAYSDSSLLRSFFVVVLAVVTMTGAGVMLSAKSYGVQRLHGRSFGQILLRDLRQLGAFWAAAFAAVTAAALLVLGLYNGLAWFGTFALVALGVALVLGLVSVAVHAVMLQLTGQTALLRALKGELPARTAALSTYLVRVPALLLAVSITGDVVLAGQNIASREESIQTYREIGDTTAIALNGSAASQSAFEILDEKVGGWLREADRDGEIIVAGHRRFRHSGGLDDLPDRDLLIVNESYLAAQPVRDASGRRVPATTSDDTRVRLLVPAGLTSYSDRLATLVPALLNPGEPQKIPAGRVVPLTTRDGQRLFTYNPRGRLQAATNPDADESFVTDPVVIVYPDGAPYLSDRGYIAYASQQSLVFKDPDDVTAGIEEHELETYVTGMSPVGQNAALRLRDLVADFRLQLFNLGVAVLVLLITGVGACIVHSRKNAQAVFARYISGWRFAATHRPLLVVEGVLAVLLAVWVPFQVWWRNRELAEYRTTGVKPPAEPVQLTGLDLAANTALVVVEVAAVLVGLAVFHRRIVKEGAAEA
ncbi:bacteriocin-associated integral membrane family protein [Streptomyces sp. NPDC057877]|uniref:bacteriocin-associated integral membrane family protein n=1 Tax=Streptomyces sp. NPDC057877 TaxID=3346269 RepID=UPI00369D1806